MADYSRSLLLFAHSAIGSSGRVVVMKRTCLNLANHNDSSHHHDLMTARLRGSRHW
jgi:hypothetical protein